jgi:DNA polymerase alpha subunit B
MQEQLFKHAGLPAEVLLLRTAVGVPSQDTVVCFGRVCCEAAEGKINKTSVMLEGGRMEGGQRVKLVLSELGAYALFPGQFVVVEGINSSGGRMVVTKLCEGVPRPLPTSPAAQLARVHHSAQPGCQGGAPLKVMVGCGPFCCSDNLDYEPLRDLLHQATKGSQGPVDVLVLTGPFVDANHPAVAKGAVEMTAQDGAAETVDLATLFYYKVSSLLEALYDNDPGLGLQIVLVPSLSDAHHDHVFPQPPLGDHVPGGVKSPFFPDEKLFRLDLPLTSSGPSKRLHVVGNPSLLTINEVVVAVTSTDVLMQLGKEEVALRPVASNRIDRLVDHLLLQQSFYPLYPAPADAPLDLRFNDKWRLPLSPDLLVTPSRLATFAKRLPNGTLALNPGQLAKGGAGGTYAVLTVHPLPKEHLEQAQAASLPHQVADRTAVQIKRI